jgi:Arabinose efflux permease
MTEKTKRLSALAVFTLLIVPTVWNFEAAAVNPALNLIQVAFPDESIGKIQFVGSLPFLTSFLFSIVAGRLANHIDKKKIAIVGLALYGIVGMLPAFCNDMNIILLLRLLTGIGVGLVVPIPAMYIAEYYEGVKKERMLGFQNATFNFANSAISISVGVLLIYGWHAAFYSFGFMFIVLFFVLIGLPKSLPDKSLVEKQSHNEKVKLPGYTYIMLGGMILLWTVFIALVVSLAMLNGARNIVPLQVIGVILALPGGLSAVGALLFPVFVRFKYVYIAIDLFILGGGFLIGMNAQTPLPFVLCCVMVGIGQGGLVPYIVSSTINHVSPEAKDAALGVVQSGMHLGGICGTALSALIFAIGTGDLFKLAYSIYGYATVAAAIIFVIVALTAKTKSVKADVTVSK